MSKNTKLLIIILSAVVVILLGAFIAVGIFGSGAPEKTEDNAITEVSGDTTEPEKAEGETAEKVDDAQATDKKEETTTKSEEKPADTKTEKADAEFTPTFMYFVTTADEERTKETIDKLKKEYEGKVTFDIRNVDKNPEDLENFSVVDGRMPALIMLNTENAISDILSKCEDYDKLKASIEKAFGN